MAGPRMLDRDWVRRSFLVSADDLNPIEVRNRFFTSASLKYTDTSPGSSVMVNPPPQFTRLADIKPVSIRPDGYKRDNIHGGGLYGVFSYGTSLGRYYSEALDDNAHLVHFRMGKTAFNSLGNYFTTYYNYYAAHVARTGRAPGWLYRLGRVAGALIAIANWKFAASLLLAYGVKFALRGIDFAKGIPSTKFAYLKPTMPIYWATVQTLVNHIAAYSGFQTVDASGQLEEGANSVDATDEDYGFDFPAAMKSQLNQLVPDIFDAQGNLNVYAYATRGQRLANAHKRLIKEAMRNNDYTGFNEHLVDLYMQGLRLEKGDRPWRNFAEYLNDWMKEGNLGHAKQMKSVSASESKSDMQESSVLLNFMEAEMNDGAAFVTFRVEEGGSISESFSNSAGESPLKQKMDAAASNVRSQVNMFAGGNIGDNMLADAVEGVAKGVKDLVGGVLDTFSLGGLAGLGSGSFADIPQHWESSQASMPRSNYTIKLHTPYADPVSKFIHETVPLCMVLAMVFPHSTGPQSYTGPFMLEYYDKGRAMCRYGMIDSVSITRGTASTPYSQDRRYNGIEISLSVMDLTQVMHMPVSEGFNKPSWTNAESLVYGADWVMGGGQAAEGAAEGAASGAGFVKEAIKTTGNIFTDDTNFTDYMAILGSVGLADNIYTNRKLRMRLNRATREWRTQYSVPAIAMAYGDTAIGRLGSAMFRGSEKSF